MTAQSIIDDVKRFGFYRGLPVPPRSVRRDKRHPLGNPVDWAVFGVGVLSVGEGVERRRLEDVYFSAFVKAAVAVF